MLNNKKAESLITRIGFLIVLFSKASSTTMGRIFSIKLLINGTTIIKYCHQNTVFHNEHRFKLAFSKIVFCIKKELYQIKFERIKKVNNMDIVNPV